MLSLANEIGPDVSNATSLDTFKGTARGWSIANFASLMAIPLSNVEELFYQIDLGHLDTLLMAYLLTG